LIVYEFESATGHKSKPDRLTFPSSGFWLVYDFNKGGN